MDDIFALSIDGVPIVTSPFVRKGIVVTINNKAFVSHDVDRWRSREEVEKQLRELEDELEEELRILKILELDGGFLYYSQLVHVEALEKKIQEHLEMLPGIEC
jgi:hypothetical protein